MRNIIKALGIVGTGCIIFATSYFIKLYVDFTQLILSLGVAGVLILAAFIYIYNWMETKDGELEEMNKATDMTRGSLLELQEKLK